MHTALCWPHSTSVELQLADGKENEHSEGTIAGGYCSRAGGTVDEGTVAGGTVAEGYCS